jgi:peroxiredoxin
MSQLNLIPELKRGELAPPFALADRDGARVTRSQFRDRRILLLAFAPDGALDPLISDLEVSGARLQWLETEVLVIRPVTREALPESRPGFRFLSDPDLTAARSYAALVENAPVPTLVLLDRYGTFEQRWAAPTLPNVDELLGYIEVIALRCSP